jgi:hypothetical protein
MIQIEPYAWYLKIYQNVIHINVLVHIVFKTLFITFLFLSFFSLLETVVSLFCNNFTIILYVQYGLDLCKFVSDIQFEV